MKLHSKIADLSPYIEAATAGPSDPCVFYNYTKYLIEQWKSYKIIYC